MAWASERASEWVYMCVRNIISFGMLGRMVFGMSSSIYVLLYVLDYIVDKITHECRIIVSFLCTHSTHIAWVQWLTYSCPISTHSSLSSTYIVIVHSLIKVLVDWCVCMSALVAMRRGLAAMRRKTFHIPVCFFFFALRALSHIPIEQQSLGVLFSIH